jgi:hypothetical protein
MMMRSQARRRVRITEAGNIKASRNLCPKRLIFRIGQMMVPFIVIMISALFSVQKGPSVLVITHGLKLYSMTVLVQYSLDIL